MVRGTGVDVRRLKVVVFNATGDARTALLGGHVDLVAQMLFGYGWLQAALALRLMRWSSQAGLVLGYWAYSFGVMAMASTAIRIAARSSHSGTRTSGPSAPAYADSN